MRYIFGLILVVVIGVTVQSVYASSITTNQNQYYYGDSIIIFGSVYPITSDEFVGLRIMNPKNTDIVAIDQFIPNPDGTFSRTYLAQGPKWQMDGLYTATIFYGEKSLEKKIQFFQTKENKPVLQPLNPNVPQKDESVHKSTAKLFVKDFPNIEKSPQYYYDRYYKEIEFKEWFDQVFPGYSIEEVAGYKQTHVDNYPDPTNPPQYYIDRYSKELKYKEWFEQQFPGQTIYEVLGYPESMFHNVPNWIKNNAKWWSADLISDSDFFKGIEYMISEKIIEIDAIPTQNSSIHVIPSWIKNTAKWWGDGLIEEKDFLNSIKFLIENKVISI